MVKAVDLDIVSGLTAVEFFLQLGAMHAKFTHFMQCFWVEAEVYEEVRTKDQLVHSYLSSQLAPAQATLAPIPEGNLHCGGRSQCNYTNR